RTSRRRRAMRGSRRGSPKWRSNEMKRLRAWLAVWGGWDALEMFFRDRPSLTYRSTGRPANWRLTITRALSEWWLWALLTPGVVLLSRRVPLDRSREST